MNHKKKNFIKVLLVILLVVAAGVIYSFVASSNAKKAAQKQAEITEETKAEDASKETEESSEKICVHVCGSVVNPGVYYLENGARIHEAVEQAGGMTEEADRQYVNLAGEAEDGSQIYIPSVSEVEAGLVPAEPEGAAAANDGLVNINTAGVDELKTLPGIGDIKAEAILSYRESVGSFASIEEIMNVAGIKESAFEKIREHIKV